MTRSPICVCDRLCLGSRTAARRTRELYMPIVYRWCRRWGVPRDDIQSLVRLILQQQIQSLQSRGAMPENVNFRSMLWSQSCYSAAEHTAVDAMALPEHYPQDVADGVVRDDTNRLLHLAADTLLSEADDEQQDVFECLITKRQTPVQAAMLLPFSVRQIRSIRNRILRRLHAEYARVIGLT